MHVQRFHDEEKSQKIAEAQQNLRKEIADEKEARKSAARKRRNYFIAGGPADDRKTEEEIVQDQIDSVAENCFAEDGCFWQMRSEEMQLTAQFEQAQIVDYPAIDEDVENHEIADELGAKSDGEVNSDDE